MGLGAYGHPYKEGEKEANEADDEIGQRKQVFGTTPHHHDESVYCNHLASGGLA